MPSFVIGLILGAIGTAVLLAVLVIFGPATRTSIRYGLVPCLGCKGSGKKNDQGCHACKGEGLVMVYLTVDGKPKRCFRCRDGSVFSNPFCKYCDGTGWAGIIRNDGKEKLRNKDQKFLKKCTTCGGGGKIGYDDAGYTNNPEITWYDCDICKGTGYEIVNAAVQEEGI